MWIRENGHTQGEVAAAAGRSNAWLSKRLRGHSPITAEDRDMIRKACSAIAGKRVTAADLFESEAA